MSGEPYHLYRYANPDGTAKEWAYEDLGAGQVRIRWGRENHLAQSQFKTLHEAVQRAWEKERKGYRYVGIVMLDANGKRAPTSGGHAPTPPPQPAPAARGAEPQPLLTDLQLTEGEQSFYF